MAWRPWSGHVTNYTRPSASLTASVASWDPRRNNQQSTHESHPSSCPTMASPTVLTNAGDISPIIHNQQQSSGGHWVDKSVLPQANAVIIDEVAQILPVTTSPGCHLSGFRCDGMLTSPLHHACWSIRLAHPEKTCPLLLFFGEAIFSYSCSVSYLRVGTSTPQNIQLPSIFSN